MKPYFQRRSTAIILLLALSFFGCSTTHYKKAADQEVYGVISEKAPQVPGMDPQFSIDAFPISLEDLPKVTDSDIKDYLGDAGKSEVGASILSLEKTLEIAVKNSRDYQSKKESLYSQILDYTETRQEYRPVFGGSGGASYSAAGKQGLEKSTSAQFLTEYPDMVRAASGLTGNAGDILQAYADVVEASATVTGANAAAPATHQERSISGDTAFNVKMLMEGGAAIALSLSTNFFRFVKGDPADVTSSLLSGSITQPLLGSNRNTARERLTQAERDLLYGLRSFTRYRQSYSIDIASSYYRVLQSRDAVRNNYTNYQATQRNLKRKQAENEAGRLTKADLGRFTQDALQSANSWTQSIQSYQDSLDRFKMRLGLPTDAPVILDETEMDRLMERGLLPPPTFSLDDAISVAHEARLDYYTQRDQLEDAERHMKLVMDSLWPDIDIAVRGATGQSGAFNELNFKEYNWNAGLNVDPKLNRRAVRNRYRKAMISFDAAKRSFDEFEDSVKLEVRESWRALEQAKISYEIQKNSVEVSERRVLEQELLLQMGEANTLNLIDAQNALVKARNDVSRALVDHTLANLNLWLDMGILFIKENGQWEEVKDVKQP